MHNFSETVAIVTGAGSGIGFHIASELALSNGSVIVNDIDSQLAETAADNINESGGRAIAVVGNCSDIDVIDALIESACRNFGRLDMAVANAGITTFGNFLDYPVDQFQQLVDLNLRGTFYLAQRAARQIIKQNDDQPDKPGIASTTANRRGGRILLMSSVTGIQYHPDLTAYAMSKAAIRMLAKSLGAELGVHSITVNAIAPGATTTERTLADSDYASTWSQITPTGNVATTADISNAAMFLLSDSAAHITGQTLVVDGGWTSVSPPPQIS